MRAPRPLTRSIRSCALLLAASAMLAPALTSAQAPSTTAAAPPQPAPFPADVGPGRVAWFDVTTTDLGVSKDFYGKLFDWTFAQVKGSDKVAQIVSRGTAIGTIRVASTRASMNNGVGYIQVDDADAVSAKAKSLGATVVPGFPFNLPSGVGAIGLFIDPAGHPMGIYSRAQVAARTRAKGGAKAPEHAPEQAPEKAPGTK